MYFLDNSKLTRRSQERLNKLMRVLREDFEKLAIDYDSDEDYIEKTPSVNDKFDILYIKTYFNKLKLFEVLIQIIYYQLKLETHSTTCF